MIEISNVCKSFGSVRAVDDLSLNVPQGELFCFLGPNGAGKTTTIKMLTGLMRPDRGDIRIAGRNLAEDPVGVKQLTGYIPDTPYLYERLTPTEYLHFVSDLYGLTAEKTAAALDGPFDQLGLRPYEDKLIGDMSHGMRQRLIYVATFMHEPRVMLIDEPLVGLDPRTIRLIKDLLCRKTRQGITILLTTHILAVAEEIADRIGIMSEGKLIALGTLPELLALVDGSTGLEDLFLTLTSNEASCPAGDGGDDL